MPSGPDIDLYRLHLFVICTDSCENGNQVIVSITSYTNELCDKTCVLLAHEHAFLLHKSYVFYRKAAVTPTAALVAGVSKNLFTPKADMNAQSFLRIYNGLCVSPQTPRLVKAYLGCPPTQKADGIKG